MTPGWRSEHRNASRRDFRSYALMLVPLAFCLGVLATSAGAALLLTNHEWGSRVDVQNRQLLWWDTRLSATTLQENP